MIFDLIVDFFDHPFFIVVGGVSTGVMVLLVLIRISSIFLGVTPLAWRFSIAVWNKKIGIIANEDQFQRIFNEIDSAKVVKTKNISKISTSNIEISKEKGLLVVDYDYYQDLKYLITLRKTTQVSVVIFARPNQIAREEMDFLSTKPNVIVTNFFGRLLNDIVVSMVSTSVSE